MKYTSSPLGPLLRQETVCEPLPLLPLIGQRIVRRCKALMHQDDLLHLEWQKSDHSYATNLPPGFVTQWKHVGWDVPAFLVCDITTVSLWLHTMLRNESYEEKSTLNAVETKLIQQWFHTLLDAVTYAFAPLISWSIMLQKTYHTPRAETLASSPMVCLQFSLGDAAHRGHWHVMIPSSLLEPIKSHLRQDFFGDTPKKDTEWQSHMRHHVTQAIVPLKVILGSVMTFSLRDLHQKLQVGHMIPLTSTGKNHGYLWRPDTTLHPGHIYEDDTRQLLFCIQEKPHAPLLD